MDEYISREALLAEIATDYGNWTACNDTDELYRQGVEDNYSDTIRLINDISAADVQPVRHGRWIEVTPKHSRCSVCDTTCMIAVYPISKEANYCPNCGARIDLKGGDAE